MDNGIQKWTVPHTGTYEIEAHGAAGANGTCTKTNRTFEWHFGGLGARKKGRFDLKDGTILKILVGQSGTTGTDFGERPGGGGGGSFVTYNDGMPLIIAGGGGGVVDALWHRGCQMETRDKWGNWGVSVIVL